MIGVDVILDVCMHLSPNESCLIVSDNMTPRVIEEALFSGALKRGSEVGLLRIRARKVNGEEPPSFVREAMKRVDVVLVPTSKSLTHTNARREANKHGARIASMPGITPDMLIQGGLTANYEMVNRTCEILKERLKGAESIHITTPLGTDVELDVKGRRWHADRGICREKGCITNLPAGEVYVSPKNAEGVVVVDGSMAGIGKLDGTLRMEIRDRCVVEIEGEGSSKLNSMLDEIG
jgi:leucyl aminopeptidase (aminopeptidase T)